MLRLLDMGCGPGFTVLEVIKDQDWQGVEYFGIDTSEKMLKAARRLAKRRYPGIKIRLDKVLIPYELRLDHNSGNFDYVIAMDLLHYLNRPEKAASLCYANHVLKKGGELLAGFPGKRETDAAETEGLLKSLGYGVERKYLRLDYEGIDHRRYYWTVAGKKPRKLDTVAEFEKYRAMSYLKAAKTDIEKVERARSSPFSLRELAVELRDMETADVSGYGEAVKDFQWDIAKRYGKKYSKTVEAIFENSKKRGVLHREDVDDLCDGFEKLDIRRFLFKEFAPKSKVITILEGHVDGLGNVKYEINSTKHERELRKGLRRAGTPLRRARKHHEMVITELNPYKMLDTKSGLKIKFVS